MSDLELDVEVAAMLRSKDQRYTTGRRRLVNVLQSGGGPLTMVQILEGDDSLAQSSVYRNLAILEDAGAVTRIVTRDDFARYELAEHLTEHHHHLICSTCGDVLDFSLEAKTESTLDKALGAVAKELGFLVEGHRLDLMGVCIDCQAA